MKALEKTWHCSFTNNLKYLTSEKYAAFALNCNLGTRFGSLWKGATIRIAADGGGNRIFDQMKNDNCTYLPPHYIKGDLDSLRHEVESHFKNEGSEIILDKDQNSTDFHKCLDIILDKKFQHPILVCGALGGSLTHTLSNINCALSFADIGAPNQIYLISDENIIFFLPPGIHHIHGEKDMYCGIVPVSGKVTVNSSKNLKYPLDGIAMEAGKLISTSNQFNEDKITIDTPSGLVFLADSRSG